MTLLSDINLCVEEGLLAKKYQYNMLYVIYENETIFKHINILYGIKNTKLLINICLKLSSIRDICRDMHELEYFNEIHRTY